MPKGGRNVSLLWRRRGTKPPRLGLAARHRRRHRPADPAGGFRRGDAKAQRHASGFSRHRGAAPGAEFRVAGSACAVSRIAIAAAPPWMPRAPCTSQGFAPEAAPFSSTMEGYYGTCRPRLFPSSGRPAGIPASRSINFRTKPERCGAATGGCQAVGTSCGAAVSALPLPIPARRVCASARWLVVPRASFFGSEELSARPRRSRKWCQPPPLRLYGDARRLGAATWRDRQRARSGRYALPAPFIARRVCSGRLATMSAVLSANRRLCRSPAGHARAGLATRRRRHA